MQEFFNMGGYAFYVWSSFGFSIAGLVYLYFASRSSYKNKLKQVTIWQAREKKKS